MSDIESQRRSSSHNRVHPNDSKPDELVKNHELISMENLKSPPPYITDQEQEKNDRKLEEFNDDDDDSDDETEDPNSGYSKFKNSVVGFLKDLWNRKIFRISLAVFFIALYFAYFGVSMALNNPFGFLSEDLDALNETINVLDDRVFSNNQSLALLVLTIIVVLVALWDTVIFKLASKHLHFKIREDSFFGKFGSWIIAGLVFIGCAIYFFLTLTDPYNMVSLGGIVALILVAVLLSNKRSKINWYILLVGIEIQFIFGVFLLRTEFGYKLFKFLSDQVIKFLEYTDQGSELVFGEKYTDHIFAFKSIPVMIFFSAIINTLYYLGVVQYIILKASWILNFLMGTSPCESMNSTANIFIGITEAPLLIKPFLPSMSRSELFSLMTSGFATVAGTVFAAYVNFKVPANHLIIASIMAAPGALAVSKTIYPATKKSKVDWDTIRSLPRGDAKNIFEAISLGASNMVGPIAGILSNLIAFVAIFAFLDSTVQWAFSLIDVNNFGITDIMQYLFYPFAFLMGIIPEDCKSVSKLIGIKVFVNEFVAYAELGKTIQFRDDIIRTGLFDAYKNGSIALPNDVYMIWNDRSIVISTYALCGFANFGAIGIAIGGLSALAPTRFNVFSGLAFKAMIAGNITNFISASIAGLLYNGV